MIEQTEAALDHKVNVDTVNPNVSSTIRFLLASSSSSFKIRMYVSGTIDPHA